MSAPDLKSPFEVFLFAVLADYTANQMPPGVKMSTRIWQEQVARAHDAWHQYRKPRRNKPIADETAWIESLKKDPALEGVEIEKELAKCQFWCRNQPHPIVPSRRRIVNWLNKADRTVAVKPKSAVEGEPTGWLPWMRENLPGWRRFHEEAEGHAVPAWPNLQKDERAAILVEMRKTP